jgi:hypothetical protein
MRKLQHQTAAAMLVSGTAASGMASHAWRVFAPATGADAVSMLQKTLRTKINPCAAPGGFPGEMNL